MAPSHVPSDHLPHQTQNIYTDPSYENLFPRVNQFNAGPTWDQFNPSHASLLPQASSPQSWQHNSLPQQSYTPVEQPYGSASHGYQAPPSFQYTQFNNHTPLSNYGHPPAASPSLGQDLRQQQQSPYQQVLRTVTPQGQPTVTPQALQQSAVPLPNPRPTGSPFQIPKSTTELFAQQRTPAPAAVAVQPVSNPTYEVPKGKVSGGFYLIDQAALAKATQSIALNKLVNFGQQPFHLPTNRTTLPIYNARQSVKEVKKSGVGNKKLLDKLAKKGSTSSTKILLSKAAGTSKPSAGSPSATLRDVSDSDSYTDSSDESDYTDDEEDELSPLPATKPDEPHGATRFDIIKTAWYPRKSRPSAEKIKTSLTDLWKVLNTIQMRWRNDSKAVLEAEQKKLTGDLPVLRERVTSQRSLMHSALKFLLEFGHSDVVYHLGQIKPFLYMCYQFLANRFKVDDYDGELPTVIYEVLARCAGMLTNELIEETKLLKALTSMKKHANAENKALIQQIIDGAAAGSKKSKVNSPPKEEQVESKTVKRPATVPAGRSTTEGPATKKLKPSEASAGLVKKASTATTGAKAAPVGNSSPQKRPGEKTTTAPVKAKGTQVVNKPSSFFSTLNAASKKPTTSTSSAVASKAAPQPKATMTTTAAKDKKPAAPSKPAFSFAQTMAQLLEPKKEPATAPKPEKQLPPETAEEKKKRLRKESRRHLRVSFRPDANLVDIRYFSHDPDEEVGHEENFVRDAGDIGGEGRMFKQHRDMDEDDDDEEPEVTYREWKDLTAVDFSTVNFEERERNYEPYGGGLKKPESAEKEANIRRENSTLMVFYSHPSDIPSSPREPLEPPEQEVPPAKEFGAPPQFILDRAPKPATPAALPALPDLSNLESIVRKLAGNNANPTQPPAAQSAFIPPQPITAPAPDASTNLTALLSQLQSGGLPAPPAFPFSVPAPATSTPQPAPSYDISAFLAAMQQNPPPAGGFPTVPPPFPFPQFPQPQQQNEQSGFQQQPGNEYSSYANGNNKRSREDGNSGTERDRDGSRERDRKSKKHRFARNDNNYKVIACRFFQQGKCTKGDDCTFIHDRN